MRGMRSWVILLATVAGVGLTSALGRWQLSRADQKLALHDTMVSRQHLSALNNEALPCDPASWQGSEQRPVRLQGTWRHDLTVYLDNRPMDGRAGFVVLTPLSLAPVANQGTNPGTDTHACPEQVVLVQRGWVPRHQLDRTLVPPVPTWPGLVVVTGRLAPAPSQLMNLGAASDPPGQIRQNVDLSALSRQWRLGLRPGSIQQLVPEQSLTSSEPTSTMPAPESDSLLRHWWQPSADVVKHQAYAAQWFAMAAIMAGLYLWFQWIKPRRLDPVQRHS